LFTHEQFCSFVRDVTKADDVGFAEPLWKELYKAGPTVELLSQMLEPFWNQAPLPRRSSLFSLSSYVIAQYTGFSTASRELVQLTRQRPDGRKHDLESLEAYFQEQLEPRIRTLSAHVAAFVGHLIPGALIYHIATVDEATACTIAFMSILRNLPEGILLTSEAIRSRSNNGASMIQHCMMDMQRFCRAFTGSFLIGASEGLGAGLAYLMAAEDLSLSRMDYIWLYLVVGGIYIYVGVGCYLNKAKEINPDKELPSYVFMVGTTVMGFAMMALDAGPLRTGSILGNCGAHAQGMCNDDSSLGNSSSQGT
jgi:hypothetical protein